MGSRQIFNQWLMQFRLGWLEIASVGEKQIFMVIDLRKRKMRYLYVMAGSRKEVMEWILSPENKDFLKNSYKNDKTLEWFFLKEIKRGKIWESFEIVRLLENELPKTPFPVLDAMDRGSFKAVIRGEKSKYKEKNNVENKIYRFSESVNISPLIKEFSNDWNWDFPEAVFQIGVFLNEFDRMYLLRFLYRRENLIKKFLGWKVHLIHEIELSENLELPFWNLSVSEEKKLENILSQTNLFTENDLVMKNTPRKDRKRRFEFQKKIDFF